MDRPQRHSSAPDDGIAKLLEALDPEAAQGSVLAQALGRLDWVAPLPNSAAPGLIYLAGAVSGIACGGAAADLETAAWKLSGEAAETLAQRQIYQSVDTPLVPALEAIWGTNGPKVRARSAQSGREVGVPAAAVFTNAGAEAARDPHSPPRSLGLAAGQSAKGAALAGALELIERDAATRWWYGGAEPGIFDLGDLASASVMLRDLRKGAEELRLTQILRLEAVADIPVACAVSCDADGHGLAFGLKAALDASEAAKGAALELLQMEIALQMARLRAARAETTEGDQDALGRAELGMDEIAISLRAPRNTQPIGDWPDLLMRLESAGIELFVCDLTSGIVDLPVAKVFADGLKPFPDPGARPVAGALGERAVLM